MKKVFILDGGAGRIICSIPALEKYVMSHPEEDIKILIAGWDTLLWGNKLLQRITFNLENKGAFDNYIKEADEVIKPEPYFLPEYFKQKVSLIQAFDILINGSNTNLNKADLYVNEGERKIANDILSDVQVQQKNKKTIVIQPFGSSSFFQSQNGNDQVVDYTNRSFNLFMYSYLIKKLSSKYNLILFADQQFHFKEDNITYKPNVELRLHMAIIESCDYFIGCDSVGQHMARSFDKKGTIIFGSTYPENISYPDWFQIVDKNKESKFYSPMRINMIDSKLSDFLNSDCMNYSSQEMDHIYSLIVNDIEGKK